MHVATKGSWQIGTTSINKRPYPSWNVTWIPAFAGMTSGKVVPQEQAGARRDGAHHATAFPETVQPAAILRYLSTAFPDGA